MSDRKLLGNVFPRLLIRLNNESVVVDIEDEKKALHEAIEIKYFIAGTSTLLVGDKVIEAKAGDVIVVNSYEFHATIGNGKEEGRYHLIIVPLEYFLSEVTDDLNLKQMLMEKQFRFQTQIRANKFIKSCFLRIIKEHVEKRPFHHMIIRSLLLEMFGLLFRESIREQGESGINLENMHSYQTVEPALRHIRDHYKEYITVDGLAELCQLSKHYFCRLFRSVVGKTSMEYLREYRMKVAYAMLESTDETIQQIAEKCGFLDDNYFCRCFRQYYGVSPGKFRESVQREKGRK